MRILLAICLVFFTSVLSAQVADNAPAADTLPYLKYPKLPAFNIMRLDSTTIFNTYYIPTGKPILIMFFDPDCSHCKDFMPTMAKAMDSLKDIRIYMIAATSNMRAIQKFYDTYELGKYKNIEVVGRDYEFFFISYYGVRYIPDFALYDEHKKLIKLFESRITVDELYRHAFPAKK
jgi:thiol-disulfide isomerase/thioredoxin